ncbi:hypothetical protein [Aquimarina algiphila]|uniref:Uncharacterized protein n=1 Tax=Aquimarina algiphila TaxID=2047982 RepID=A0A554VCF0_9FLAO|nr:hypothetical protein [Aquimarina algiphila]TSE04359.1 hypothetical protein FOF46_26395 [Aquimarina algiphila]
MAELKYIEKIVKWLKALFKWSLIFTIFCIVLGGGILLYGLLIGYNFDEPYADVILNFGGTLIGGIGSFPLVKMRHRLKRIDMFLYFKSVLEQAMVNNIQNDETLRIKELVWKAIEEMSTKTYED